MCISPVSLSFSCTCITCIQNHPEENCRFPRDGFLVLNRYTVVALSAYLWGMRVAAEPDCTACGAVPVCMQVRELLFRERNYDPVGREIFVRCENYDVAAAAVAVDVRSCI